MNIFDIFNTIDFPQTLTALRSSEIFIVLNFWSGMWVWSILNETISSRRKIECDYKISAKGERGHKTPPHLSHWLIYDNLDLDQYLIITHRPSRVECSIEYWVINVSRILKYIRRMYALYQSSTNAMWRKNLINDWPAHTYTYVTYLHIIYLPYATYE